MTRSGPRLFASARRAGQLPRVLGSDPVVERGLARGEEVALRYPAVYRALHRLAHRIRRRGAEPVRCDGDRRGAVIGGTTYALPDAREAQEDLEARRTTGSVILAP